MSDYLKKIESFEQRAKSNKLNVSTNIFLNNGTKVDLSISNYNFYLHMDLIALLSCFFIYKENPTIDDFRSLYENGLSYSKRTNDIPNEQLMYCNYITFPCIFSNRITNELLEYVNSRPRKHIANVEFPVFYEIDNNRAYYYSGTYQWGRMYLNGMKDFLSKIFNK